MLMVGPRDARRPERSKRWYIAFTGPDGQEHVRAAFSDKAASAQRAAEFEKAVARGQTDLIDKYEEHRHRNLASHVEDFEKGLVAKGTTAKQAHLVKQRVLAAVAGCGFKRLGDISGGKVTAFLPDLRTGTNDRPGVSHRTSNFHLGAMGQFCRWAVRDGRMSENPLVGTQKIKITDDRKRRALTVEEKLAPRSDRRRPGSLRHDGDRTERPVRDGPGVRLPVERVGEPDRRQLQPARRTANDYAGGVSREEPQGSRPADYA